jgi:hypothetical protein
MESVIKSPSHSLTHRHLYSLSGYKYVYLCVRGHSRDCARPYISVSQVGIPIHECYAYI